MTDTFCGWNVEVMWRRVRDDLGLEQARFLRTESGLELTSTLLAAQQGLPLRVDYRIACDELWHTRRVHIDQTWGSVRHIMNLKCDRNGIWLRDGVEDKSLAGCTDVEFSISPCAKAVAIHRVGLSPGGSAETHVASIFIPDLAVTPAHQNYHRISDRLYEHTSLISGSTIRLRLDGDGLLADDGGSWRRVAQRPAVTAEENSFSGVLISEDPSTDIGQAAADLGWLVRGWMAQVRDFDSDAGVRHGTGEWWFSWVLAGGALQDVWIVPARRLRKQMEQSQTWILLPPIPAMARPYGGLIEKKTPGAFSA